MVKIGEEITCSMKWHMLVAEKQTETSLSINSLNPHSLRK